MELRPCLPGEQYEGPVRVPVSRPTGAQSFSGVIYRPIRQFWHLRTAAYNEKAKHFQQMAEQRRIVRKAEQEQLKIYGPSISIEDPNQDPLDSNCKILKQIENDGVVRLFYRRKERFIIYDS